MIRIAALVTLVLLPRQDPPQEDVAKKLDTTIISVDEDAKLAEALANVADKLQVNIWLDPAVRDKAELKLMMRLRLDKVRASSVLHWMTKLNGLKWSVQGNLVVVSTADRVYGAAEQRMFDDAAASRGTRTAAAPELKLSSSGDAFILESPGRSDETARTRPCARPSSGSSRRTS